MDHLFCDEIFRLIIPLIFTFTETDQDLPIPFANKRDYPFVDIPPEKPLRSKK